MRGYHDLGGLSAGPVQPTEHDYAHWEKRADAMLVLLSAKGLIRTDELRRGIESLGADVYERLSYYERWIGSMTQMMLEKGVITIDELGRRMAEIEARDRSAR